MKGEYWNIDPYCYCANSAWGKVDGIRDIPIGGAAVTGLSGDDTAALAAGLIGLAALLPLLLCILCCLCPAGLCLKLCPCLAGCCGKKSAAAAGAGAAAGGAGGAKSDKLREV
ncbi:hypothetical protein LOTGIDRAFT_237073 [Lottia gigantea]|uniref:Uncharacterized protein n=1 Tax=Lottia gigantea TaxID=225164 RepID=V3ZIS8_LOTGI|nr:hypothetical protein LOTGIDRAFT_237073 [Lottia gigantea]ESO82240.1 hypothetical protein LOTGIDRAFT_237073 [Lottia gigantea]